MNSKDMAAYMRERRSNRRADLLLRAGGKCLRCGSTERLEFDHRDRTTTKFRLTGKDLDGPWDRILGEFEKCDLLCESCHKIKTREAGDNPCVEHGGGREGKRDCPCDLCVTAKRTFRRNYMRDYIRGRDKDKIRRCCEAIFYLSHPWLRRIKTEDSTSLFFCA